MKALDAQAVWQLLLPLLLALPRITAIFVIAPLLAPHTVPALARNGVVLAFSLAVYPYLAAHLPAAPLNQLQWTGLVARELLVGGLIGYAVGSLLWALEGAGALIDVQSGLSNAMLFEPFGTHPSGVFGAFMAMFGILVFISLGGLYVLLSLLFDSYRLWPPGLFEPSIGALFGSQGIAAGADVVELTVRAAAPVVLVLVLLELGLGLLNRAVPQLNVFFFALPIKGVLAALTLALSLGHLAGFARSRIGVLQDALQPLARSLGLQ